MVDKVEGVQVVVSGDAAPANAAIDSVGDHLKQLEDLAKVATAAFAGFLTVDYFKKLIEDSINAIDQLNKMAEQTGSTVAGLQALERAGEQTGTKLEDVTTAAKALNDAIVKLGGGKDEAINDQFKELGITFEQLKDLAIDQRFGLISDKIKEMDMELPDQIKLWKALGVEFDKTHELLALSGDDFEKVRTDLAAFGTALTDIDAAKVSEAKDAIESLGSTTKGIGFALAIELAPILKDLADRFTDFARTGSEGVAFVKTAIGNLGEVLGFIVDAVSILGLAFSKAFDDIVSAGTFVVDKLKEIWGWVASIASALPLIGSAATAMGDAVAGAANDAGGALKSGLGGVLDQIRKDFGGQLPSEQLDAWLKKVKETSDEAAKASVESAAARRQAAVDLAKDAEVEEDKEKTREQQAARRSLDQLMKTILDKEDAENISFQRREMQLAAFRAQGLITEQQYNELEEANNRFHLEKMYAAQAASFTKSQQLYVGLAGQISNLLGGITSAIGNEGKKQFAITKAISIAQALIKGYESVVSSYAAGAKIGGPPVGAAFAAIAAATTAVQIAALRSTNADSGGGGAPAAAGAGDASAAANVNANQTLTIEGLNSNQLLTGDFVKGLLGKVAAFTADGGKAIIQ